MEHYNLDPGMVIKDLTEINAPINSNLDTQVRTETYIIHIRIILNWV